MKFQLEHRVDLLITSMPVDRLGSSVERVLVSSFFSSEDRRKIQDTIQSIKKKRRSEYCARETFAAVTTLDRPVDWGRSKVELVIMFAINQQDFHLFDQFLHF